LDEWFHHICAPLSLIARLRARRQGLAYHRAGLRLEAYTEFEIAVPITLRTYLPYVLSETGWSRPSHAASRRREIRAWCQSTFADVFGDTSRDVLFAVYVAYVSREGST
jgi:hypothetical protein